MSRILALSTGFFAGFIAGACATIGVVLWVMSDPEEMNLP